jgi:signal transduction histidine kinase
LITNVAHDLRTPLTSILGYLDLLTQGDFLTEEQKQKYLGIVSSKAKQLETLVKDLFDYTRYDRNKVKIKKEILDLNLFVPQLVDEFYPSFMDHQLECRTAFYEGALNIEGNGELLARAIGNLISNAIKYGADGKLVEVHTGLKDKKAFVAIVNYGKIIPAKDLDKIFDKFYRVENSRSLKTGGTGLGLAIAKNIINLHEGNIWATSDESGTRFQIELPVVQAHMPNTGK